MWHNVGENSPQLDDVCLCYRDLGGLTDPAVSGTIVRQPLVRLVADAQDVVSGAQVSDRLELLRPVNLPEARRCVRVRQVAYFTDF